MLKPLFSKNIWASPVLLLFVFGGLLAIVAELPYGGWLQIPLLSLIWWRLELIKDSSLKHFFLCAFSFSLAYFVVGLWWLYISLHDVGGINPIMSCIAVLLLSAYVALYFSLACFSIRVFKSSLLLGLLLAASWVLCEYLRSEIFTGFPWMGLAEAQVNGPFAPIAPYLGGLGCTFLVVLTSWLILHLFNQTKMSGLALVGIFILTVFSSVWSFTEATGKPIRVELIQGNFSQSMIFKLEGIRQQIRFYEKAISQSQAELIVAPETAFPWPLNNLPEQLIGNLQQLSNATGSNLLFGVIGRDPNPQGGREFSNRALGLTPNTQPYQYDKNHLVPFGEFIPPGFRWFVNAFSVPLSDFARGGDHQANFTIIRKDQAPIQAAITICYEDVFGGELASRIRNHSNSTNLLINLTNLAWFGQSQAPAQQLRLSQLRSLETGLPALRATNTGITSVLGPKGTIQQTLPEFEQATLIAEVQAYTGITPYVRWGNLPILSLSCLLLIWGFIRHRRF